MFIQTQRIDVSTSSAPLLQNNVTDCTFENMLNFSFSFLLSLVVRTTKGGTNNISELERFVRTTRERRKEKEKLSMFSNVQSVTLF
jgi:hypothetical protein